MVLSGFIGKKNQDEAILPLENTQEWTNRFKEKYTQLRNDCLHSNFGENIALYYFLYSSLKYRFDDPEVEQKVQKIKKYTKSSVFEKQDIKRILADIDEVIGEL
ncbi:hypothetical protein [Petroclostridium sp. X23]|uniref:hypothetical protein n=1 Tax=Petroclostridium sp. X23 TaxID=3045146 RepID=UPI0024AE5C77|nr:hypothetical protein [Petroclostridium sp. X23]WHH57499.1 hypothetical protein QKW49_16900 [Petroclostridium sp. X23]